MDHTTEVTWEAFKSILRTLYLDQSLSLAEVAQEMATMHQFYATKAQYELQFKKWHFRKNRTAEEWRIVAQKLTERKQEGKESEVVLNGKLISSKKIRKETLRYGSISAASGIPPPGQSTPTPRGFIIRTPSPKFNKSISTSRNECYVNPPASTGLVLLDCLPIRHFNSALVYTENPFLCIQEIGGSDLIDLSQYIPSSLLKIMTERHVEDLSWPFNAFIEALVPANFFLRNQTAEGKAISEGQPSPVLRFLQLTIYLVSNNLLGSTTQVSEEVYRWIRRQSNVDIIEHLLPIGGPTVEALAENLFRLAIDAKDVSTVKKMKDFGIDPNEQVCHNKWGDCRTSLMQACDMKNVKLVKALIDGGAKVDSEIGNGDLESVLTVVLKNSGKNGEHGRVHVDPELIRILLDAGAVVNPGSGKSPLANAVELGQVELVELLVSAGADVNILIRKRTYMTNPLYIAVAHGDHIPDTDVIEMGRILLNAGADPNGAAIDTAAEEISTVLYVAMRRKSVELIQLLLENGARVTESAFVEAVYHCGLDIVNLLHIFGGYVTVPVIESAVENNPALMSFLLDITDEKLKGKCKTAALIGSIQFRNMSLIQSLNESGTQLEKSSKLKHAIFEAIKAGDTNILKFLLDKESNYRVPSLESLDTAMWAAITYDRDNIVKMLLMAGAPLDTPRVLSNRTLGNNVILAAILKKDIKLAKLLLDFGAPVNEGYYSVLPAAVDLGYHPLIQDIIKAGAEIDAPLGMDGETALFIAVRKRDTNAMNILLAAGADINMPNAASGQTALNAACHNNDLQIVQYLLELGADSDEWSLVEAISGSLELVQILLTARLHRYKRYSKGYGCGALHHAINLKNPSMIEFLLAKGIDPNAIYNKKFGGILCLPLSSANTLLPHKWTVCPVFCD